MLRSPQTQRFRHKSHPTSIFECMKISLSQFAGLIFVCFLWGCIGDMSSKFTSKPNAFGKAGRLYVLADPTTLSLPVADTLDFYFGAAYPILPQPEPLFDIITYDYDDLAQDAPKTHLRAYLVLVNMEDQDSDITKMVRKDIGEEKIEQGFSNKDYQFQMGRNKWAVNQLLIYIIGKNESALIDGIKSGVADLTKRFYAFDGDQYEANLFHGGHNEEVEELIRSRYKVNFPVPDRYAVGIDSANFLWLQDYIPDVVGGLVFYKLPYHRTDQFSRDAMIELRDSLTGSMISGPTSGSYMVVDTNYLPTFHYSTLVDDQYASELRGYWVMKGDFMGGAFATYVIQYPDKEEILFVDAFVYGPGERKREPMKQLNYLIGELEFVD